MEIGLTIVYWLISLVALFALPALVILLLCRIFHGKAARIVSVLLVAVLTFGAIAVTAIRPPVCVGKGVYGEIGEENMDVVKRMNTGFYSKNIPFLAVKKVITSASSRGVVFTTYYYPFGSTVLQYDDGIFDLHKRIFDR